MRKFTAIILTLVGIAFIGGGSFFVFQHRQSADTADNTSPQSNQIRATIIFDGDSFEPEITTLNAGGTLKIVNQSTKDLSFNSDDHPTHTQNSELNVGIIDPGVSKSVIVHQAGTWGFHNHFNSSQHGEVTVQ